jgi:serine/threonine-protein kinase
MLLPGSSFGRYRVEKHIGVGGMGSVYLARDEVLERRVALKVMLANEAAEGGTRETMTFRYSADRDGPRTGAAPKSRARFLREGRAAAALHHPNVVTVFDVGEVEGVAYLAMEYVDGGSLRPHVERGDLPLARRLEILCDVARALAAAHAQGVIHRDVKPENVLVSGGGAAKVADFGIARREDAAADPHAPGSSSAPLGATARRSGTPAYMAPEQVRGDAGGARSDQFAWGVLAFELLAGRHPFARSDDVEATGAAILDEAAPDLLHIVKDVPPHVARAVARALAKNPSDRFPSSDALVRELVRDEHGKAGSARRSPRWAFALAGALAIGVSAQLALGVASRRAAGDASPPPAETPSAPPPEAPSQAMPATTAPPPEASSDAPPPPSSAAPRPPRVTSAPKPRPSADPKAARCNPPFEYDAEGTKKWKLDCL